MLILLQTALPCTAWEPLTELAAITHPDLTESSGLAPSRRTPGALWTHDDEGDPSLFRFALDGTVSQHAVPDADNRDWEDVASAPCPGAGPCLYVADIGADRNDGEAIDVWVVREPAGDGPATLVDRWRLAWPGVPRDAETLLVHPCTLEAFVVTKGAPTELFRVPSPRGRDRLPLEPVGVLDVDEAITGGSVSPAGDAVVLRSEGTAWRVPWTETGLGAPERIETGLDGGEAVAWEPDGDLLFTDEGFPTAVSRRVCAVEPTPECAPSGCGCRTTPFPGGIGWLVLGLSGLIAHRHRSFGTRVDRDGRWRRRLG